MAWDRSRNYEAYLGLPAEDDYVLSSKKDGTRSWVQMGGGSVGGVVSGDLNGTFPELYLNEILSSSGSYGSSGYSVVSMSVDKKGRVTAIQNRDLPIASATTSGILSSTDWTRFNDGSTETDPVFTAWLNTNPLSNYITTNTEQLSLSGNKTTTGVWKFQNNIQGREVGVFGSYSNNPQSLVKPTYSSYMLDLNDIANIRPSGSGTYGAWYYHVTLGRRDQQGGTVGLLMSMEGPEYYFQCQPYDTMPPQWHKIAIQNQNATFGDLSSTGLVTSTSGFRKSGGTSSQYLMADGSVSLGPTISNPFTIGASTKTFTGASISYSHDEMKVAYAWKYFENGNYDDDQRHPGIYTLENGSTGTRPPGDNKQSRVLHMGYPGRITQIASTWNQDRIFFRRQTDSTWSQWFEIYHEGSLNMANYVSKVITGVQTMVGELQANGVQIGNSNEIRTSSTTLYVNYQALTGYATRNFAIANGQGLDIAVFTGADRATTLNGLLSGVNANFSSTVTATQFIKSGGLSTQFLMADGSVITSVNWSIVSNKPTILTSIAGLSTSTTGLIKLTNGVASLDSNTYLTSNQTITLSGDVTGSGTTSITTTLANSGVTAGTYNNSATAVKPFTVDAKGRITSVGADVVITPAWSSITSKPTTLGGYGISSSDTLFDSKYAATSHNHDSTYVKVASMGTAPAGWANDQGPAWNASTGSYTDNDGGANYAYFQAYNGSGSTPSFQLKATYANGAIWWRSSRDYYGFENGWREFWHSGNFDPATYDNGRFVRKSGDTMTGILSHVNGSIYKNVNPTNDGTYQTHIQLGRGTMAGRQTLITSRGDGSNGVSSAGFYDSVNGQIVDFNSDRTTTLYGSLTGTSANFSTNVLTPHFRTSGGGIYIESNEINSGYNGAWSATDTYELALNYRGYDGGTAYFRDTIIYNGKQSIVAKFTGSNKSLTLYGDTTLIGGNGVARYLIVQSDTTEARLGSWGYGALGDASVGTVSNHHFYVKANNSTVAKFATDLSTTLYGSLTGTSATFSGSISEGGTLLSSKYAAITHNHDSAYWSKKILTASDVNYMNHEGLSLNWEYNMPGKPLTYPMVAQFQFDSDQRRFQLAFNHESTDNDTEFWIRSYRDVNSGWRSWRKVWHSGNFDPANYSLTSHTHAWSGINSGLSQDIANTNLNSLDTSGFYYGGSNITNNPWGNGDAYYITNEVSGDRKWRHQTAKRLYGTSASDVYVWWRHREGDGGSWSPWVQAWHSGNFNPSNYLLKSGDTMTGTLSGTSASFNGTMGIGSWYDGNVGLIIRGTSVWQAATRWTVDGQPSTTWTAGIYNGGDVWQLNSENVGNAITVQKNRNIEFAGAMTGTTASFSGSISEAGTLLSSKYAALSHTHSTLVEGDISDLNFNLGSSQVFRVDRYSAGAANAPTMANNANAVMTIFSHPGTIGYGKQIAFTDNEDLYIRRISDGGRGSWHTLLSSYNYTAHCDSRYLQQSSYLYTKAGTYETSTSLNSLTSSSYIGSLYTNATDNNAPVTSDAWWNVINVRHRGGGGPDGNAYGSQIVSGMTSYTDRIWFRNQLAGTWGSWKEISTNDYYGIHFQNGASCYKMTLSKSGNNVVCTLEKRWGVTNLTSYYDLFQCIPANFRPVRYVYMPYFMFVKRGGSATDVSAPFTPPFYTNPRVGMCLVTSTGSIYNIPYGDMSDSGINPLGTTFINQIQSSIAVLPSGSSTYYTQVGWGFNGGTAVGGGMDQSLNIWEGTGGVIGNNVGPIARMFPRHRGQADKSTGTIVYEYNSEDVYGSVVLHWSTV